MLDKAGIAVDTADSASRVARNMGHILGDPLDTERRSSTGWNNRDRRPAPERNGGLRQPDIKTLLP